MINWSKIDTLKRGGNYVLVIFSAGSKAREMSKLSDEELQIKLMVQLRHMFPKLPSPLSFTCTRWDQDPFTLGSYSYLATGASPTHRMAFHTPLVNKASQPRVWFAGEHTIVQCPAMTHGAYLSGVRAAKDILSYRTLMKK
jgi:monoamine oxidase